MTLIQILYHDISRLTNLLAIFRIVCRPARCYDKQKCAMSVWHTVCATTSLLAFIHLPCYVSAAWMCAVYQHLVLHILGLLSMSHAHCLCALQYFPFNSSQVLHVLVMLWRIVTVYRKSRSESRLRSVKYSELSQMDDPL